MVIVMICLKGNPPLKLKAKAKQLIAWIGLMALLLMGFANLQGMVLCFEPDGRVSLENAVGGICSDSFQAVTHLQSPVASSGEASLQGLHCKKCVDVPISIESTEHQDQQIQTDQGPVQMPMIAETASISIGYLATATEHQMPQPPPLRPAIHRFLGTIILLI